MAVFMKSVLCVLGPFTVMLVCVGFGFFDNVEHDIGVKHYAEQAWIPFLPFMPFNTIINLAYVGLGLYWCALTRMVSKHGIFKHNDTFLFYTFNIMCTLYGLVQLLRIVLQSTFWAVMDQWCTFPFFSLLVVWGLYYQSGWSSGRAGFVMLISLASYTLSLYVKTGFEIALGLHVFAAVYGALVAYITHRAAESLNSFFLAILYCSGFVILKLLDLYLPDVFFVFQFISGHFLSKICDVAQIACVNNFFFDLTLQKAADISVAEQEKYFDSYDKNGLIHKSLTNDIMYEVVKRPKDK